MRNMRRQPYGMDGRHDPDTILHPHGQQATQRTKQLAAGVAVRIQRQFTVLGTFGGKQHRTIGCIDVIGKRKQRIWHGG